MKKTFNKFEYKPSDKSYSFELLWDPPIFGSVIWEGNLIFDDKFQNVVDGHIFMKDAMGVYMTTKSFKDDSFVYNIAKKCAPDVCKSNQYIQIDGTCNDCPPYTNGFHRHVCKSDFCTN